MIILVKKFNETVVVGVVLRNSESRLPTPTLKCLKSTPEFDSRIFKTRLPTLDSTLNFQSGVDVDS